MSKKKDNFKIIEDHIWKLKEKAIKEFHLDETSLDIDIYYNLNSIRVLGMFVVKDGVKSFRFNKKVIVAAGEKKYLDVVTHEFAHLVVYEKYFQAAPHGKEWQKVMQIFGAAETSYKTTSLSKYLKKAYSDKLKKIKCKCHKGKYTLGIVKADNLLKRNAKCVKCGSKFKEVH